MKLEESGSMALHCTTCYSNQDSRVLVQKQKWRSTIQDRKPRDKPVHLWAPNNL